MIVRQLPRKNNAQVCLVSALFCFLAVLPSQLLAAETNSVDKKDWWAFKPAEKPAVPPIANAAFSARNEIDNFILAKLSEHKLNPSSEADRRVQIRRLSFDLTGLGPTPADMDAFLLDGSANAYERLVDRLLASPRYGEYWARHWLDVVHYGESHGYDKDKPRTNAWPYRDYVIRSFNQDKPYSRFVEEQLAGDALFPDNPDGIVALGFIAAGPWDYVGHVELPITKTDGLIARYNDRDDMVMTTISTFQSLTVHCARCHDHKFDPITQRDYYALQAVFAGVDRADRPYDPDRAVHIQRQRLNHEKQTLMAQRKAWRLDEANLNNPALKEIDNKIQKAELRFESLQHPDKTKQSASNGYHSEIVSDADATKWVQVDLHAKFPITQIRLWPARPTDYPDTPGFGFPVRFRVEISEGKEFKDPRLVADFTKSDFPNPGSMPLTIDLTNCELRFIRVTATRLWKRKDDYVFALAELQAFDHKTNVARAGIVSARDSIESGRWAKIGLVDGFDRNGSLNDAPPSADQAERESAISREIEGLKHERAMLVNSLLSPGTRAARDSFEGRSSEITKRLSELPAPAFVYAAANDFPPDGNFSPPTGGARVVNLLTRGDVKRPKEEMAPGAVAAVPGLESKFQLPETHNEGSRRAALANWITSSTNMLTRRSIVNRVWQYHFGRGLVDTPNDFGHMGSLPTHPELLDWLAFWFMENGESLKKLHRLIVTSAAYRQTSSGDPAQEAIDGENRFLWRMNRGRLDAECVRDMLLLSSGRLDLRMGGPSDAQYFFKNDHSPVYDYTKFDVDSPAAHRRSVYRHIVRSVPDPLMDCLDAADASQLVARRYTTLTALQALALLNDPFVLRQCEHFADRLTARASDLDEQIEWACRWTLARKPTESERAQFREFASAHGMVNLCRLLFNTSEFLFID